MIVNIITLFPQVFDQVFSVSIIKRAQDKKLVKINLISPRDFAVDKHKTLDDKPYGGGRGMIMKVDIIIAALESIPGNPHTILMSASGKRYSQNYASKLAKLPNIAIICGHYEGVDARVEEFVDEVVSIGDFVMTGGEIAAMAIVDSVTRLIPGVIRKESLKSESFSQTTNYPLRPRSEASKLPTTNLIEYPQYTRPEIFRDLKVPPVLLSGNHKEVATWRQKEAFKRTRRFRPDLLKGK